MYNVNNQFNLYKKITIKIYIHVNKQHKTALLDYKVD